MMQCKYLTLDQVLKIHELLIQRFGGSFGLFDHGLFESAVFRPQQTFDGEDLYLNVYEKAAALLESLCKNHPFLDGNKRIAFTAAVTFLKLNGIETEFEVNGAESFVLSVAEGKKSFEDILKWLEANA